VLFEQLEIIRRTSIASPILGVNMGGFSVVLLVLFFMTLMMGIVLMGITAGLLGAGGMIASSYATKKDNRTLLLLSFGMLLLFGVGCVLTIAALMSGIIGCAFAFAGMLVGIAIIICAILGIVFSKKVVEKKVVQVLLYILYSVGIIAGILILLADLGLLWLLTQIIPSTL
jgi:hypothetical protein